MGKVLTEDRIERFELARHRIREISEDSDIAFKEFSDFFMQISGQITYVLDLMDEMKGEDYYKKSIDDLREDNRLLFSQVLPEFYEESFTNPDYAEEKLGIYSGILCFVAAELVYLPHLIIDGNMFNVLVLLELFLELYSMFSDEEKPTIRSVEEAVFYYAFDYVSEFTHDRMEDTLIPSENAAYNIVMKSDLSDQKYLFGYGEYITDNEIKLSKYLSSLSDAEIDRMAEVYTQDFRTGFDVNSVDFTGKKSVNIRYHVGEERIVRSAIRQFGDMGLKPILSRYAVNRVSRRGVVKAGYESTSPNQQFEYDHRMDEALFLDGRYSDKKVNAAKTVYEEFKQQAREYAGPAVIESFGEELFDPKAKESVVRLSDEQQTLSVDMNRKLSQISNEYIPGDAYSFTIIAFPVPDIGDNFEEIFSATMELNTLDNDKYRRIQQTIIDTLDKADYVTVRGAGDNKTDMHVSMRTLSDPEKETQFENCVADVNIPVGEVFTSPVLKGTEGVLNVSSAYLNGYFFKNISLSFKDGVITDYSCDNYPDAEDGRKYIKENILFNHETLPIGEFAIGTNTTAYMMAGKYDILAKLPILIVEKTGPHFAVGDTCYSHAEDKKVYNPDGKEIISRENDFSLLRNTEPEKAYFNCHTDITIPYNELESIVAHYKDGTEIDIIRNGRFVLSGTEELNEAFDK